MVVWADSAGEGSQQGNNSGQYYNMILSWEVQWKENRDFIFKTDTVNNNPSLGGTWKGVLIE